jgi:hypothetical protein
VARHKLAQLGAVAAPRSDGFVNQAERGQMARHTEMTVLTELVTQPGYVGQGGLGERGPLDDLAGQRRRRSPVSST